MANKEALKKVKLLYEKKYKENPSLDILGFDMCYIAIKQDLEWLEKLEKVIELIKNKKVNMFHIWAFNDYQQYEVHYPFSEYHAEKDMLTKEEYDLLKEVLKNEWM